MIALFDLFQGAPASSLASHTPNTGVPWYVEPGLQAQLDGRAGTQWLNTGGIFCPINGTQDRPTAGTSTLFAPTHLTIATTIARLPGAGANDIIGPVLSWVAADTYLQLSYFAPDAFWFLTRNVDGVGTGLLDAAGAEIPEGSEASAILQVAGSAWAVWLNGVLAGNGSDPDHITDSGRMGVLLGNVDPATPTTGLHVQQLLAIDGLLYPMP